MPGLTATGGPAPYGSAAGDMDDDTYMSADEEGERATQTTGEGSQTQSCHQVLADPGQPRFIPSQQPTGPHGRPPGFDDDYLKFGYEPAERGEAVDPEREQENYRSLLRSQGSRPPSYELRTPPGAAPPYGLRQAMGLEQDSLTPEQQAAQERAEPPAPLPEPPTYRPSVSWRPRGEPSSTHNPSFFSRLTTNRPSPSAPTVFKDDLLRNAILRGNAGAIHNALNMVGNGQRLANPALRNARGENSFHLLGSASLSPQHLEDIYQHLLEVVPEASRDLAVTAQDLNGDTPAHRLSFEAGIAKCESENPNRTPVQRGESLDRHETLLSLASKMEEAAARTGRMSLTNQESAGAHHMYPIALDERRRNEFLNARAQNEQNRA